MVLFSPVVALLVTEFTPPVVRPTPLFTVPVTAFDACPTTPGFFAVGVVTGVLFFTGAGVGFVPSAFTDDLAAGAVFFTGVVLAAVEVVFVTVFAVLSLGAEAAAFFMFGPVVRVRTGAGVPNTPGAGVAFFAAVGVCVAVLVALLTAGLLVATGVFFAGVAPEVLGADGTAFFTAVGVVVAFTGGVFFAGVALVDTGVAVLFSLAGAFFTGVTDVPAGLVAVVAVFLTGVTVFCAVEGAVLGADDGVFFAVGELPATVF